MTGMFPFRASIILELTTLPTSSGGINLVNGSKRITIDNTLDERLRLLEDRVSCLLYLRSHLLIL